MFEKHTSVETFWDKHCNPETNSYPEISRNTRYTTWKTVMSREIQKKPINGIYVLLVGFNKHKELTLGHALASSSVDQ